MNLQLVMAFQLLGLFARSFRNSRFVSFFALIFSFFLFLFQVLKDSKSKPIVAVLIEPFLSKNSDKRGEI